LVVRKANLKKVSPKRQLPFWSGQLPFWHCELPFSFLLGSYKNRVGRNPGVPKFRWAEIRVGRDSADIRLVVGLKKEWHLLAYQSSPQAWRKASIGKICRLLGSTHDKENVALISHTFKNDLTSVTTAADKLLVSLPQVALS
jgi:hypothetical protein